MIFWLGVGRISDVASRWDKGLATALWAFKLALCRMSDEEM
jgi:hypothetical protein